MFCNIFLARAHACLGFNLKATNFLGASTTTTEANMLSLRGIAHSVPRYDITVSPSSLNADNHNATLHLQYRFSPGSYPRRLLIFAIDHGVRSQQCLKCSQYITNLPYQCLPRPCLLRIPPICSRRQRRGQLLVIDLHNHGQGVHLHWQTQWLCNQHAYIRVLTRQATIPQVFSNARAVSIESRNSASAEGFCFNPASLQSFRVQNVGMILYPC